MVRRTKQLTADRGISGASSICVPTRSVSCTDRGVKRIPLTQGQFAIVDSEDFDRLNRYKWRTQYSDYTCYAIRQVYIIGLYDITHAPLRPKTFTVTMARQILGLCIDDPRVVDHRDHDGLNNRRSNLRRCTRQQNRWNSRKMTRETLSRYKGVCFQYGRWVAAIGGSHIGTYDTECVAAKAYDEKAVELFGEFACLNFPVTIASGLSIFDGQM